MAPRKRASAATPEEADAAKKAADEAKSKLLEELRGQGPADLIKTYRDLRDYVDGETSRLNDFLKPSTTKMQAILDILLEKATVEKVNNYATDAGTAYISSGITPKVDPVKGASYVNSSGETVTGREALLDWLLDNWDAYGAEWATVGIALDGVKAHMAATKSETAPEGIPPPGIAIERWIRMNVRKA